VDVPKQPKKRRASMVKTRKDLVAIIKKEMPGWRIVRGYKFPKNNKRATIVVKVESGIFKKIVGVSVATGKIVWYQG